MGLVGLCRMVSRVSCVLRGGLRRFVRPRRVPAGLLRPIDHGRDHHRRPLAAELSWKGVMGVGTRLQTHEGIKADGFVTFRRVQ